MINICKAILIFYFIILSGPCPLSAQPSGSTVLLGDDDPLSGTGDLPPNVWKSLQFTARASGTATCFKVFLKDLPNPPDRLHNLGYALYTNDASAHGGCGNPGTLIAYGTRTNYNWSVIGTNKWHEFPLNQTAQVTQGSLYWVAFCSDGGHDGWHFGRASALHDPGHAERKRGCNTHTWNDMPDGDEWNVIYPNNSSPCTDNGNYSWYFSGSHNPLDIDLDGVINEEDNCPNHPNGPLKGTCTQLISGNYIVRNAQYCTVDGDCDPGELCEKSQADNYPPGGNGAGDACDCEGDFNCDGNVAADDSTSFLADFGRNQFNNPCTNNTPCNGDMDCDGTVDATDAKKFLEDFGRNQYNNPCPPCERTVPWCNYQ